MSISKHGQASNFPASHTPQGSLAADGPYLDPSRAPILPRQEAGKDLKVSHTCTSRMQCIGEFSRASVAKNIKDTAKTVTGVLSLPTQGSCCTLLPMKSVESDVSSNTDGNGR